MKKFLAASLIAVSMIGVAHAEGWHHGGGHYVYRPGFGWVVPAIIGGAIVYEATRPVPPQTVIVQPAPNVVVPSVAPPSSPIGYHWEAILDASCNCYRTVLVPN